MLFVLKNKLAEVVMKRWKGVAFLLAVALLLGACATLEDAKGSMKKSFPKRTDNTAK